MKGFDAKWRDVPLFIIGVTKEIWEDLETVYCSYPADSPAANAIMRGLDAEVVSSTTAWQKP